MGDQLALDGMHSTLFDAAPSDAPAPGARVFSLEGRELCAACGSELKRGGCRRCTRIGATAPALELEPVTESCLNCGATIHKESDEPWSPWIADDGSIKCNSAMAHCVAVSFQ